MLLQAEHSSIYMYILHCELYHDNSCNNGPAIADSATVVICIFNKNDSNNNNPKHETLMAVTCRMVLSGTA